MPLETGTYISDLVPTNPDPADSETYGSNHIQLIKATLKTTFAAITGAVSSSHVELSTLVGAASSGATIKVVTQPTADNSNNAASTAYVNQVAFKTALPAQAGNAAGSFLMTNGASAAWTPVNANDICLIAQGII